VQVREKVLAALGRGESAGSIAKRLEVGERSVYRLQARRRAGLPIEPGKTGARGPTKLTPGDERLLREEVERRPGVTAKQMIPLLSVPVVESTICRAWQRMGLSLKKSR
jgi:transposase